MENIKVVRNKDRSLKVERIDFNQIKEGDVILHLFEEGNQLSGWMGEALEKGVNTEQWYGDLSDKILFAATDEELLFVEPTSKMREPANGRLVAAEWHATEAGHSLWRIEL